ncbi:MAG: glycosyltransferase, partial [Betaproteobacteria bacterium]|nr:glycosyltransferase [Betaproteobacteria bacterium]
MPSRAIFTIVSNNYLHLARTLMQSVAQHHPEAKRYCVVVDADLGPAHALQAQGEFEVLALSQLGLPDGDDFLFQYTVLELNTAVKPWALAHLLAAGHAQAFYIDPDIHLYGAMREVVDLLDGGHDVVLTPHLLSPMTDALHPSELDIRRAGTYNLGFCAMRDTPNVRNYLHWWQGKLRRDCTVEVDRGIFVDQSWMDLVPGMFERVAVLRHAGYNVAYWNLAQRRVTQDAEGGRRVNGVPLVFFHF